MNEAKGLKIIHLNIRSLVSKIDQLCLWVALHKPHIVTLSETWLDSNISNSEINMTDLTGAPGVEVWPFSSHQILPLN